LIPEIKNMRASPSKGTALVTAASGGIRVLHADCLAKRGYNLFLLGRSEAPLQALAACLSSATGRYVTPIATDFIEKADLVLDRVRAEMLRRIELVDVLTPRALTSSLQNAA
jgi:short-subunit dehydrogenase